MMSYQGQLYIDLPYDKTIPTYLALEAYLERPDGGMRFAEARFFMSTLHIAMKNAKHDESGLWEK
jgi:hypothetical protein